MSSETPSRVLLLVEDNPGDAQLVNELLSDSHRDAYHIVHVPLMSTAVETLRTRPVHVVVLDLRLPDCAGVDTVKTVREVASDVPIVVLTGSDDEQLAMDCIDAGAQDYLPKTEVRAQNLRRALGYAITRIRDAQVRHLQETLARYRTLSSATQATTVTAALAGSGAIAQRNAPAFARLVQSYYGLLQPFLARETDRLDAPVAAKEIIITTLGDAGGGPRDLLDVHVAALDQALALHLDPHARSIVYESRLLALEMMGLLVDYYRVGHRRRSLEEIGS
jgi:DNA-binding response OmpR family regulator